MLIALETCDKMAASYFAVIRHVNLNQLKSPIAVGALCRRTSLECSKKRGQRRGKDEKFAPWGAHHMLIRCTKQAKNPSSSTMRESARLMPAVVYRLPDVISDSLIALWYQETCQER